MSKGRNHSSLRVIWIFEIVPWGSRKVLTKKATCWKCCGAQLRLLTLSLQWHQSVKLLIFSNSIPYARYWDSKGI